MYRIEDTVSAIKELQRLLGLHQSGNYDRNTKNAVISFQKSNGLAESGIVDYETFTWIVEKYREQKESLFKCCLLFNPTFPYTIGSMDENTGTINRTLERVLKEYFYEDTPPRGRYLNSDTFKGVNYLQKIFGIRISDEIDAYFINRLIYELDAIEIKEKYT